MGRGIIILTTLVLTFWSTYLILVFMTITFQLNGIDVLEDKSDVLWVTMSYKTQREEENLTRFIITNETGFNCKNEIGYRWKRGRNLVNEKLSHLMNNDYCLVTMKKIGGLFKFHIDVKRNHQLYPNEKRSSSTIFRVKSGEK